MFDIFKNIFQIKCRIKKYIFIFRTKYQLTYNNATNKSMEKFFFFKQIQS